MKKQIRREMFLAEMEAVAPFLRAAQSDRVSIPAWDPKGKATLSAGGDATHSPDAELVFPQRCGHGE